MHNKRIMLVEVEKVDYAGQPIFFPGVSGS